MTLTAPAPENTFQASHIGLLLRSLHQLTGRHLADPLLPLADQARFIYNAPYVVLSHNDAPDPILTYGNLAAQQLFGMTWQELTATPSRFTAEAPNREERAALLDRVTHHGFIDDYSGIRISKTGQRFRIHQATVWNLLSDNGQQIGQAATFSHWSDA